MNMKDLLGVGNNCIQCNVRTMEEAAPVEKKIKLRVNFINVLQAAFTCADPKSTKRQLNFQPFLRFCDLHVQKLLVEC